MDPPSTTRPFAVVTGASSGIGYEIARVLAGNGHDLLIVAEDREIEHVGIELERSTSVDAMQVNLARTDGIEMLHQRIIDHGRPVDVLVLNTGIGAGGVFVGGTELEDEMDLIDLNVRSIVHICKLEIAPMIVRGEGRVHFTSPVASTRPGAHQAVYNASKAFVRSFAVSLRTELRETNVTITSMVGDEEERYP